MTTSQKAIVDRIAKLREHIEATKRRHKGELIMLRLEIDKVRINCKHEWSTRSIMGRDTVTECKFCDVEYPG